MTSRLLGRLLRGFRAGTRHLARNHPSLRAVPDSIRLQSASFASGGAMPTRCAGLGVGENTSPALQWSGVPAETEELVLIMEDPDAPLRRPVVHLIALGIAPSRTSFSEGALSQGVPGDVRFGVGSFNRQGYHGPRPVPGHGPHKYLLQVIALEKSLQFQEPPTLDAVLAAANGNVLARGEIVGQFER
jgi:Raf kinase inhibitor-like YbhB/YbcL family protein